MHSCSTGGGSLASSFQCFFQLRPLQELPEEVWRLTTVAQKPGSVEIKSGLANPDASTPGALNVWPAFVHFDGHFLARILQGACSLFGGYTHAPVMLSSASGPWN